MVRKPDPIKSGTYFIVAVRVETVPFTHRIGTPLIVLAMLHDSLAEFASAPRVWIEMWLLLRSSRSGF
jgi:hypothetical protein